MKQNTYANATIIGYFIEKRETFWYSVRTNLCPERIVISGIGIKSPQLRPPATQIFRCCVSKATNIGTNLSKTA